MVGIDLNTLCLLYPNSNQPIYTYYIQRMMLKIKLYIYTHINWILKNLCNTHTPYETPFLPQLNTTIISPGGKSSQLLTLWWHKILINHTEVQIYTPNTVTHSLQYGQYHPNQIAENHSCNLDQSKTIEKKQDSKISIQLSRIVF